MDVPQKQRSTRKELIELTSPSSVEKFGTQIWYPEATLLVILLIVSGSDEDGEWSGSETEESETEESEIEDENEGDEQQCKPCHGEIKPEVATNSCEVLILRAYIRHKYFHCAVL